MSTKDSQSETLTRQLRGCQVAHISCAGKQDLVVHFSNGLVLTVERGEQALFVSVDSPYRSIQNDPEQTRPTQRQLEYLRFITRYILRFGIAPAEADIQRHFLVSAPSVNQMMQTLERLGFISRQRGVARSIRVNITLPEIIEATPDLPLCEDHGAVKEGPKQRPRRGEERRARDPGRSA